MTLALGLVACGGGGGGTAEEEPPPLPTPEELMADSKGAWVGIVTLNDAPPGMDSEWPLQGFSYDGRFLSIQTIPGGARIYDSTYTVSHEEVDGELLRVSRSTAKLYFPPATGNTGLDHEIVTAGEPGIGVIGTYENMIGQTGDIVLAYDPGFDRGSSVQMIEGRWGSGSPTSAARVEIDEFGNLNSNGASSSDCWLSGNLWPLEAEINLYGLSILRSCDGFGGSNRSGNFSGFASIIKDEGQDVLLLIGTGGYGDHAMYERFPLREPPAP